jgi:PAS domain S-box-containing protein
MQLNRTKRRNSPAFKFPPAFRASFQRRSPRLIDTLCTEKHSPMPNSKPLTVLIVDDDAGTRSSLRRILKLDGYVVEEAVSVAATLDRNTWDDYFAILLDRRLPDGTAEDLLPQLRKLAPEASILIVTGNADVESSIAALRAGAADYLLKPIEPESLRARLRSLADLRIAQSELAQRDAQLEFMVDHLPAAAAYVDYEKQTVRFNRMVVEITGYAVKELTTLEDCFRLLFGEEASATRKQYEAKRASWDDEPLRLTVSRRNGEKRIIEFRGYGYDDHEVWLLHDVTDRDRHDTELRIRDRAIQSANEGVVIADATRKGNPIVFANEAFQSLSGYSTEETIGRGCELLCGTDPDQQTLMHLKNAISSAEEFRTTVQCRRKNGETYWNEVSIAPVRSNEGSVTHIVAVMEDVSERRDAQQKLLQTERLAAIGQMVAGLAHESRNALQRAQACLDMLSLDLEDQPEQLELTEKMRRALTDLHRHYEEVRNYAAPINLERRLADLSKIWERCWAHLEATRFGRKFDLIVDESSSSVTCNVDEHRVEQVFRNIIENALAACPDPGCLRIRCTDAVLDAAPALRISFQDNGPGLGNDAVAGVFQPFFTTKQKGTGLGMAISKRIVEAHGGRILLGESELGANIVVELPRG